MARTPQPGPPRPTAKEAKKKVRAALDAVRAGKCHIALDKHFSMSLEFLDAGNVAEMWPVIEELLEELNNLDALQHYAGRHPPDKSYEAKFKHDELWPFRWASNVTGKETYLKFIIKNDHFFFIDCHEHREQKK